MLGHFSRDCKTKLTLKQLHQAQADQHMHNNAQVHVNSSTGWVAPKEDTHDAGWDGPAPAAPSADDIQWGENRSFHQLP